MKILLLNTFAHYGGASIACRRLQVALNQSQLTTTRLLTRDMTTDFGQITAGELGYWGKKRAFLRFVTERLQTRWAIRHKSLQYSFSPASRGQSLAKHAWVQEADVLHFHWTNFGFLSLKGLKELASLNKKMVWTLHDMWAFTGGCHYAGECKGFLQHCGHCPILKNPKTNDLSSRVWKEKQAIFKDLQARLQIVTCSKWLADIAKESTLLKNFAIQNIPNPIDTEQFYLLNKTTLRKQFGIPADKFVLLFSAMNVGDTRKGLAYLIEALELLYHQMPESRHRLALAIVGKSAEKDIKLLYPTYYLGSLATPEAMNEAYNLADAFVLPSLEDNLPNTIMEAMACGLPCVSFATGGLPEMITHQETGYLSTYKSAQSLADGVRFVFAHPNLASLSLASRTFVQENYNQTKIALAYQHIYQA